MVDKENPLSKVKSSTRCANGKQNQEEKKSIPEYVGKPAGNLIGGDWIEKPAPSLVDVVGKKCRAGDKTSETGVLMLTGIKRKQHWQKNSSVKNPVFRKSRNAEAFFR